MGKAIDRWMSELWFVVHTVNSKNSLVNSLVQTRAHGTDLIRRRPASASARFLEIVSVHRLNPCFRYFRRLNPFVFSSKIYPWDWPSAFVRSRPLRTKVYWCTVRIRPWGERSPSVRRPSPSASDETSSVHRPLSSFYLDRSHIHGHSHQDFSYRFAVNI